MTTRTVTDQTYTSHSRPLLVLGITLKALSSGAAKRELHLKLDTANT